MNTNSFVAIDSTTTFTKTTKNLFYYEVKRKSYLLVKIRDFVINMKSDHG